MNIPATKPAVLSDAQQTQSSGSMANSKDTIVDHPNQERNDLTSHNPVTLALAQHELGEHMEDMEEVYKALRLLPLKVYAYALDDPGFPAIVTNCNHTTTIIKTVHFVRHGQGFHNLMADMFRDHGIQWTNFTNSNDNPYVMSEIMDAPLTEKGRQQAIQLQAQIHALQHPPELVVFSPNCRALQTGVLAFATFVGKIPFVAHEQCREETGVHLCDKRRTITNQAAEFPQIDFSLITNDADPMWRKNHRESKAELGLRIGQFLEWLVKRPERHVAINSHSGWLLCLFNAVVDKQCDPKLKEWFQTGELRSVHLIFEQRRDLP